MSANDKLFDESVAHQIDLLGYSNNVVKRMIKLLNRVDSDLMTQLTQSIDGLPPTSFTVERLELMLGAVRALNSQAYAELEAELNNELRELVTYEADYQQKLLSVTVPIQPVILAPEVVYSAALARPFQGRLLKEWIKGLEDNKAALIRDAVRVGYIEGQTTSEIIKRIRGTRALKYEDGLLKITRTNAESVVLTAVAHTSDFTQQTFYKANTDIIKGVRYTATLDLRTTTLCASRDGIVFGLDENKPAIPAHWRCRSRYVAVTKSFKELGIDLPELNIRTTRASLDGQVPATTTYEAWLRKQSVERQNDVLGVAKAALFRKGDLPLTRFVSKQGHEYTLDELRIRDAEAFKKAGL
jgi:SPP1 gp7 family putative phage head morphogenesis protein